MEESSRVTSSNSQTWKQSRHILLLKPKINYKRGIEMLILDKSLDFPGNEGQRLRAPPDPRPQ